MWGRNQIAWPSYCLTPMLSEPSTEPRPAAALIPGRCLRSCPLGFGLVRKRDGSAGHDWQHDPKSGGHPCLPGGNVLARASAFTQCGPVKIRGNPAASGVPYTRGVAGTRRPWRAGGCSRRPPQQPTVSELSETHHSDQRHTALASRLAAIPPRSHRLCRRPTAAATLVDTCASGAFAPQGAHRILSLGPPGRLFASRSRRAAWVCAVSMTIAG